jgi:hypothetical protein
MLSKFQTQVPNPLSQNLKELLSPGRMRDPPIRILLGVFIEMCTVSNEPRWRYRSRTSLALKAGEGRVETKSSYTVSARCSPTEGEAAVAGLVATTKRSDGPAGESGTAGQSKRARVVWRIADEYRWWWQEQPPPPVPVPDQAGGNLCSAQPARGRKSAHPRGERHCHTSHPGASPGSLAQSGSVWRN